MRASRKPKRGIVQRLDALTLLLECGHRRTYERPPREDIKFARCEPCWFIKLASVPRKKSWWFVRIGRHYYRSFKTGELMNEADIERTGLTIASPVYMTWNSTYERALRAVQKGTAYVAPRETRTCRIRSLISRRNAPSVSTTARRPKPSGPCGPSSTAGGPASSD